MSKKIWTLISLMLIAMMALTACGGGATPTEPAVEEPVATEPAVEEPVATEPTTEEPVATEAAETEPAATEAAAEGEAVTIRLWHGWQGDYVAAYQAAIDEYMAQNPNVTVEVTNPENLTDQLSVAIPAGEGPDVIGWANDIIGSQALVGNIIPLDSYGIDPAYLEAGFEPAGVAGVVWQGEVWGVPESQEGIALVYNTALADETSFPSDPLDFADLTAKAQAFQEANPDKFLVCNQGLGNPDAYHAAPVYFGHGVPSFVDDEGNAYMDTPEAIAAATWMQEFNDFAPTETSHDICRTMILEGQTAAWWTGPWAIADLETAGIDYGILPMGKPFVGIKAFMLTSNAVDRGVDQATVDFIKYMTSPEVAKQIALANKTIPANTEALNDAEVQAMETVAGFGAALNLGVPMANTPFANAQWTPVQDATMAVWNETQSPEEAMAAAQQAIEDAIAEMQ